MTKKEIRAEMIKMVDDNKPLEFTRCEADSFYQVKVGKSGIVVGDGYAEMTYNGETIDDITFLDLAYLVNEIREP